MECRAVRVKPGKAPMGWPCVTIALGNLCLPGRHTEAAWSNMPLGMAREVAHEILAVVRDLKRAERKQKKG